MRREESESGGAGEVRGGGESDQMCEACARACVRPLRCMLLLGSDTVVTAIYVMTRDLNIHTHKSLIRSPKAVSTQFSRTATFKYIRFINLL